MGTIPQLRSLKERLGQLELQKARYGISADPHIITEADDLKTAIGQMELIEIARRNLDLLIRQRYIVGAANVSVGVNNQIASTRAEIMRLRKTCENLGQYVPAHPLDDDTEAELPPLQPQPQNTKLSNEAIRNKLDQIQALINEIRNSL